MVRSFLAVLASACTLVTAAPVAGQVGSSQVSGVKATKTSYVSLYAAAADKTVKWTAHYKESASSNSISQAFEVEISAEPLTKHVVIAQGKAIGYVATDEGGRATFEMIYQGSPKTSTVPQLRYGDVVQVDAAAAKLATF